VEEPYSGHGKWSVAGVPHRGWSCVDFESLDEADFVCEMCEHQEIRHIHYMQHPEYRKILRCGCVCAGRMEENLTAAKYREAGAHGLARRRKAWPKRKAWKVTPEGQLRIKADGYRVTIFEKDGSWSGLIRRPSTGYKRFAKRTYPSAMAAQLAAFDSLQILKARQR
jgi:hypothetical protein